MEFILIFINAVVLIGLFVFVMADRHKTRKVLSNTIKAFDDLEKSYGTVYSDGQLTRTLITEVYRYLKTWKGETMPKERFTELGDARPAGTDGAYDIAPVNEEQNKEQEGESEEDKEAVLETNAEPPSPAAVMNSRVQEKIQETQKEKRNKPEPKKTPGKAKSDAKTAPSKRRRAPAKKKAAKKAAPKK